MTRHSTAHPSSRFVTLPGRLTHHFIEAGEGEPTVVFLHGFSDSWRSFEPLFNRLGQQFRLLALDQRGHGNSEAGKHYHVSDFALDAIAFISAVAKKPVHLVGHSLGSIIAQRVAARRPDLVRSLVLIGAAQSAVGHSGALDLLAELAAFGERIPSDFVRAFQKSTTHAEIPDSQFGIFVEESLKLLPNTWRQTLSGMVEEPVDEIRPLTGIPSLSIWGIEDGIFGDHDQAVLARHLPKLKAIRYSGVGHAPHWEAPGQVALDIETFLLWQEDQHPETPGAEYKHA